MLNTMVIVMVLTAISTRGSVTTQLFDGQQSEHHRGQPTRPEPAHERDRRGGLSSAEQRDRDGHHPYGGQAHDGVDRDPQIDLFERRQHEARAEDEPQDERKEAAGQLGELDRLLGAAASHGAEDQPTEEGSHEWVAAELRCDQERDERERQRGQAS